MRRICTPSGEARFSGDASAEGVQRDLLPLVEGSSVSTKHGNVNTDYILFICSGVRCGSHIAILCESVAPAVVILLAFRSRP